uniref:Vacuolar protein sorting-associated protein 33A n=1 Tax=Mesocestoides corti TaxID=53468 RepID=A0A5K3FKC9_MESCO
MCLHGGTECVQTDWLGFFSPSKVMKKMANEERVEDLLSAQTTILLSGSGGALAMPLGREILPNESDDQMPPEAATGTCADEATCQPFRLALEWLSTRFGDRLTEAVRLLCLLSITHDGLSEELYTQVLRHIQHAVGFSIYPMLAALRRLKLLHPRRRDPASEAASSSSSNFRLGLTPVSTEKIVSATERLMRRRKSVYNRLHRFLQLSLKSQVNLSVEKPAVSPSYVFGGQHVPVVVRLAESLWATSLAGDSGAGRSQFSGLELLKREQLTEALRLLHTDERSAKNLGHVSLTEASEDSTAAADSSTTTTKTTTLSHGQTMVVAFVGGCTYAEVAALRFAASRRCWRLLIVTSQMLSTKSLIQQVGQAAL